MSRRKFRGGGWRREPIAIIGMGCRFPGAANDPESFWNNLTAGIDAITEIPKDRWSVEEFYHPKAGVPGRAYSRWGGFINGIDQFDPEAFGISPREASYMDPQQRLLLEVAWESLQDGGQVIGRLAGTKTGVFIGISTSDYAQIQSSLDSTKPADPHAATGGAASIAANRISYCLNFRGPSVAVDTACSSSLVATHLACNSIWSDECSLALAGGVNIIIRPDPFVAFCAASMLSPDGRCKAYDASADGFVRGEGAGIVVLKALSKALADGDPVYAVIVGSGVNQDGRTTGIAMPSPASQEALLREVYEQAGIDPREVDYVEAHGTGTGVGDPIEAMAIGKALCGDRAKSQYCIIGSVKTNIGHLEAAAGIAGLIKAALALKHRLIPANLHFRKPNPNIPFEELKLRVPTSLMPWPSDTRAGIAGVNSFGFGGTNAHVVLMGHRNERKKSRVRPRVRSRSPLLFPFSARTPTALHGLTRSYLDLLRSERGSTINLYDLSYTASVRRDYFDHRLAIVAHSSDELCDRFEAFLAGETRPNMFSGHCSYGPSPKVAFVFSGQGPQWWAMGRQLLKNERVFREAILECGRVLERYADWSLLKELTADEASSRLQQTAIAQPALFSLQVALAALWRSWGVEPDAVVGHSVGEVAAAHVAGALSLDDAVRVIFHRGRCMDFAGAKGKMLAVGLAMEEAEKAVQGCRDRVSIAAVNSPSSITLSGDPDALERVNDSLSGREVFSRFLRVQYAFHSAQMDPLRKELLESLADLENRPPGLLMISTVTGKPVEGRMLNEDYWWRNVREKVRFAEAMDYLIQEGHDVLLEVSPHPVLAGSISECLAYRGRKGTVLASLRREEEESAVILGSLGALYALGKPLDWKKRWPRAGQCLRLPGYPWERRSYWHEPDECREGRLSRRSYPLIKRMHKTADPTWKVSVDNHLLPYLEDHKVLGNVLVPAAAYVEMALEAAGEILGEGVSILEDIQFQSALFLPEKGENPTVQLVFQPTDGSFAIHSGTPGDQDFWTRHVVGYVRNEPRLTLPPRVDLETLKADFPSEKSSEEIYRRVSEMGLQYGPSFRGVERIWRSDGEALGLVRLPPALEAESERYRIHPAFLDSCFQILLGAMSEQYQSPYLPVQIQRARILARPEFQAWVHARLTNVGPTMLEGDIRVCDRDGNLVVQIDRFRCQAVGERVDRSGDIENLLYEIRWQKRPAGTRQPARRPADYIPASRAIARSVEAEVRQLLDDLGWSKILSKAHEPLDRLASCYVIEAMRKLGWDFIPGERIKAGLLVDGLKIKSRHERFVVRCLEMLEKRGCLESAGGDEWVVKQALAEQGAQKVWLASLSELPSLFAELTLIARCGQNLPSVLRGDMDPVQAIFPGGSTSIAEQFYQDSPWFRFYNMSVQKSVDRALRRLPAGRTVRILEVGAGTGGMTTFVLSMLPTDRSEYVFSDVSPLFLQKAEERFHGYPFVKYELLDIQRNPIDQGFEPHSVDVILASNVLHATTDLRQALANIRTLLVSRGALIILEVVKPHDWVDMVFGLTEGWWNFRDFDLRPCHPLVSIAQWKNVLHEIGFTDIEDVSIAQDAEEPDQCVLVAREPEVQEEADKSLAENDSRGSEGEKGTCVIFADRTGLSDKLAQLLATRGEACIEVTPGDGFQCINGNSFQISPSRPEDMDRLVLAVSGSCGAAWRRTVHLWSLDVAPPEETTRESLREAEALGCYSVLHYAQAVSRLDRVEKPPGLVLVTRCAQPFGLDHERLSIAQTPLIGLGRVIANEFPEFRLRMMDLNSENLADEVESLVGEIVAEDGEEEVVLRQGACFVPRIDRVAKGEIRTGLERPVREGKRPFRVEISKAGTIERLALRETARRTPGQGQVEIEVFAASLNFRDVMKVLGIYPVDRKEDMLLGDECAGRVVMVGDGVKAFKVGDEVVGIAPGSFGSHVTTWAELIRHKPEHLRFEEAVTIPIAYLTAYYALHRLGRLQGGERVLIHSAAGGVGLAGLEIARHAGAEIFATAGSPEKRELLSFLGVEHIMDSRSLLFADQILEITGGRGVDVVLNSLAGRAVAKGLSCLAPYGRFLELGKRDIYQDSKLGLWPFRKNLSFFAIDLAGLIAEKPAFINALLGELFEHIEQRAFHPLPYRVFPISQIKEAFRYMAQGKHLGKVVVSMGDEAPWLEPLRDDGVTFRSDGTYLITGGFGGFGLTVARWIVENGGRNLVLLSRSGAESEDARKALEGLQKSGARVIVAKADVSSEPQLARVLEEVEQSLPPLRGVFHAAMVLDDGILLQLNRERFRKVMAPKVDGTWNLHIQTLTKPLDYFVLFSSSSSLIGNHGQGNYVAANNFLDAFAHDRRSQGLPGVTINWGPLTDTGYVAQHRQVSDELTRKGLKGCSPKEATEALGRILSRKEVRIGVVRADWRKVSQFVSKTILNQLTGEYLADQSGGEQGSHIREVISGATLEARRDIVRDYIQEQVARVLRTSAAKLDTEQPLNQMGLDSLMAVELKNRIESDLQIALPTGKLVQGPSIQDLSGLALDLLATLDSRPVARPITRLDTPEELLTKVDRLSDEEVDSLLREMMDQDQADSEKGQEGPVQ
jgi:acyl transferase domain-containing protein/NADPH:quinone reductase-like Zn-dependent oxidoreductase/NAD(P)-dependent dehydrogenase (short-subunit alcohol dehydrogenase family)/SAM-dependent methyltransferase/acyl carrier protein